MLNYNSHIYASEYRREAAEKCRAFTGDLILIYIIYAVVLGIASSSGLAIFVTPHLACGFIIAMARVNAGRKPAIDDLFAGFSNGYLTTLLISVLQCIFIMLWTMLLFIPGMIKVYSYSMAYYIHLDRPELGAKDCITESRRMMNGHKWELFCLEFSYIGWIILVALTFGIAGLWVYPRMEMARYLFYLKVSGKGLEQQNAPQQEESTQERKYSTNSDFFDDVDSKF